MSALLTEAELAAELRLESPEQARYLRQKNHWPHVRLTRFEVRYTEAQVAQIIAEHTVVPPKAPRSPLSGQTAASARRSA